MPEKIIARLDQSEKTETPAVSQEDILSRIDQFMTGEAQILAQLMGLRDISIRVGKEWSTNLAAGQVTIDPRFFLEKGYSADDSIYACLHEISAHLREVITDPELTRDVKAFVSKGKAESIFHNIFSDIVGNNRIHAMLPRMRNVAEDLYQNKLFVESDLTDQPRHLQFLYKLIRQEMIPGSDSQVYPEVDLVLEEMRDFEGSGGDLIKYSTSYAKSGTEVLSGRERFDIWTKNIYPRWLELVELDQEDPDFNQEPSETTSDGRDEKNDASSSEDQTGKQDKQKATEDKASHNTDNGSESVNNTVEQTDGEDKTFSDYYDQYYQEHHPEPISDEQQEEIEKDAHEKSERDKQDERRQKQEKSRRSNPAYQLDARLRQETGHSLADLKAYNRERERLGDVINEVRNLFRSLLDEHIGVRRKLRNGFSEGAILTPDRLAQTKAELQAGVREPKAFSDYRKRVSEHELTGKTDYIFVFDRSGSMSKDQKSISAASSAVVCLEALAGVERDIEELGQSIGQELSVDIRTAIYTFNGEISCPKSLSTGLSDKERLDTYAEILSPNGNNADSHVLQAVIDLPPEPNRKRILVVVSDGEADNPSLARAKVEQLRHAGWQVYGISIGSEAAVELYAPHSRRVDDPQLLADAMKQFIEATL